MAANRNLIRDTLATTTLSAAQALTNEHPTDVSFGGTDAAVHWLGGVNTIADKGVRLIYADDRVAEGIVQGDEVRIVSRDRVAARAWREGFSSVAQTYETCSRCPDGRPASSGWRFIRACSIEPTGNSRQAPHLADKMGDSDDPIRRVLDRVSRDQDPSILIGGWRPTCASAERSATTST